MQVRNKLDERKYHGSYELIADLLRNQLGMPQPELEKFFQQVAFSILVRNGDAHLKNLLVHHQAIVPVTAGRLDLGPWQQVFYCEFDGGRPKRVVIKAMGD